MKVDYQNTIIYKLCCKDPEIKKIYVGHTTNFKLRNNDHKNNCNNVNYKRHNEYKYQFIRANGGYENWRMIVIKEFPCNSKQEALMEEDKVIRELGATLNRYRAYTTPEERKEHLKQYKKEYNENNKEEISEKCKEYYENHKEELNQKGKEWREKNQEYLKEYEKKRNEKVTCEFCNCEIGKRSLLRHITTNKKCLAIQEQINN